MIRSPVLAVLLSLAATAATAQTAPSKSFAGWTGTCNNIGDCVAIGTSQAEFFYVRIARAAGPAGAAKVKIVLAPSAVLRGAAPAFALKVVAKGTATTLGPLSTGPRDGDGAFVTDLAAGAPSRAFVDAIRDADTLDYALLSAKGTLELDGLSATLRWIDARQGRAGTSTAFVAKGPASPRDVPAPRQPPIVHAAKAGSVAAIAEPSVNPALLSRAATLSDCEKDVVEAHAGYSAWRLGLDRLLVEVPCMRAAYNAASALYFTDAHGGSIRPVALPQTFAEDAGTPANIVTNVAFDPGTMALSEFGKGRGIGDCGETRTWVWTGETFALLEATRLDACPGALSDDWPNTFTAVRADAPAAKPH